MIDSKKTLLILEIKIFNLALICSPQLVLSSEKMKPNIEDVYDP